MKKLTLGLIIAISLGIGNSLFAQAPKYLELTQEQLKEIGFVFNTDGTFIKTIAVDTIIKDSVYYELSYMNGIDDEGSIITTGIKKKDTDSSFRKSTCKTNTCNLYLKMPFSGFPIVSINAKDSVPHQMVGSKNGIRTIPVLLKQTNSTFKDKSDLVFYFEYTPQLAKKLNNIANLELYIFVFKDTPKLHYLGSKKVIRWEDVKKLDPKIDKINKSKTK